MIYDSITQLIGNTPLLRLNRYTRARGLNAELLAKLEYLNPAGSVKDRVALNMVLDAEQKGILKPGGTIIEPTSGNTGIGLALVAAARGYKLILTMPDTMSQERIKLVRAYGADIVLTPGAQGMAGAIARADELKNSIKGSIIAGQFENPANPEAHRKTTAQEILRCPKNSAAKPCDLPTTENPPRLIDPTDAILKLLKTDARRKATPHTAPPQWQ